MYYVQKRKHSNTCVYFNIISPARAKPGTVWENQEDHIIPNYNNIYIYIYNIYVATYAYMHIYDSYIFI